MEATAAGASRGRGRRDSPWAAQVRAPLVFLHDRGPSSPLFRFADAREPGFLEALDGEMKHYPTAEGWLPYRPQNLSLDRPTVNGWDVEVAWHAADQTVQARAAEFESHAHEHRIRGQWWLRPDLNDDGDFLWPLTTWWALLFGLSMLARYHPADWAAALRVDECDETVPLEAALNQALVAVPHFVYQALIALRHTVVS